MKDAGRIVGLAHVGVAVASLEAATARWKKLGFRVTGTEALESMHVKIAFHGVRAHHDRCRARGQEIPHDRAIPGNGAMASTTSRSTSRIWRQRCPRPRPRASS